MRPTEALVREHDVILSMLDVVRAVARKLSAGESVEVDHLDQIVDFIRSFADRRHHAKEEDLLFKSLADAGMPVEGGPVGVMLHEHTIGREYVSRMAEAVSAYRGGDAEAGGRYADAALGYATLLHDHIQKENQILYPMADRMLPPEEHDRLAREFERVDGDAEAGTAESYRRLTETLRGVYL